MKITVSDEQELMELGFNVGSRLMGGEVIELIGDIGAGKTTFTKGIAKGMGVDEEVSSPSFTISHTYKGGSLYLHHYDFYRLDDPGIMVEDLAEVMNSSDNVVVIEWPGVVDGILPENIIRVKINHLENGREVAVSGFDKLESIEQEKHP